MPINLAGSYGAGGVHDALLEIVKQRMLEQELAQRAEENQFQRLRAQKLDERQAEQERYNRGRDTEADRRLAAQDKAAAEKAQYETLTGRPEAEQRSVLGSDYSTGKTVQAPPNPAIPGGMPSYLIGQNPQINPMMVRGMKVRPPSMESQDAAAALDEQRKQDEAVTLASRLEGQKPPQYKVESTFVDKNGRPVSHEEKTDTWYRGGIKISPDEVRDKPSQVQPQQPPQPQQWYDKAGNAHAIIFDANGAREVQMPPGLDLVGKTSPITSSMRTRSDFAKRVESHIPGILELMDQASAQGMLGPVAGRFNEFLAGTIGSTGDEKRDELLNQLRTELSFLKSGMGVVHSGARGAAVQMLNRFDSILNSGKMSEGELRGAIAGYQNWLQTYGNDLGTGPEIKTGGGGGTTPKVGEKRTANGETRTWNGTEWVK